MTTTTSKSLILDSDDLSNIEKIQLTSLNRKLDRFIGKVHIGDHVDGEREPLTNIKETEEYKALVIKLKSETQKYHELEAKKLELELRVKTAEENLKKKKEDNQVVISKETVNGLKIKTLKEENEFLYDIYKKAIIELQRQLHDSEVQINVYKSSLMEELKNLKEEFGSATAMEVQRYKEENKILKERMNKMVEHNNQIIQTSFDFQAIITKLEKEICTQQKKIKLFESTNHNLQNRISVDQEITNYRRLLQKGFMRICINPPDSQGKGATPEGGNENPGKEKKLVVLLVEEQIKMPA